MVTPWSMTSYHQASTAIPAGRIIDWQSIQHRSRVAERQKIPLLAMRANHLIWPVDERPCAFGMGAVPLAAGCSILTLRLQCGTSQFYWLAHPNDPEVWRLLESWSAAGRCAFMLRGEHSVVFALDYGAIDNDLRAMRPEGEGFDAGEFADRAFELVALRLLERTATSDIEGIPKLEHVQACVLATSAIVEARSPTIVMPGSFSTH